MDPNKNALFRGEFEAIKELVAEVGFRHGSLDGDRLSARMVTADGEFRQCPIILDAISKLLGKAWPISMSLIKLKNCHYHSVRKIQVYTFCQGVVQKS